MPNSIHPMVSIIMPIKNEGRYIERSLSAVLAQDYPVDKLEILIADGNSSDGTRDLISKLALASKFPVYILDNPTGVVPRALNIGLRHAKGDIIIRVDGHCEIQKNYVDECVTHLLDQDIDCVGGVIETVGETFIAEVIATAMSTSLGVGAVAFRVDSGSTKLTDSVPFPAYWKKTFQRIGIYDEDMLCNEDDEFNYRLLKKGGHILMVGELKTRYYSRGSIKKLWTQYFRYGLWKIRVMQKHPGQMRLRQFVPSLFVMGMIFSIMVTLFHPLGIYLLLTLLGIYLLASLVASILTAINSNIRYLPILPLVFTILHVGYGLGFLTGLVKFWNRWGDKVGKTPSWPVDSR